MNWPHVRDRIQAGKDARTEFEQGTADMRTIAKAVCAFATARADFWSSESTTTGNQSASPKTPRPCKSG